MEIFILKQPDVVPEPDKIATELVIKEGIIKHPEVRDYIKNRQP